LRAPLLQHGTVIAPQDTKKEKGQSLSSLARRPTGSLGVGRPGVILFELLCKYIYPIDLHVTVKDKTWKQTFRKRDQFAPELEYFSNCILNNRRPEPSGMEGTADVRIIEGLYRSAKRRRPVKIEPVTQTQDKTETGCAEARACAC